MPCYYQDVTMLLASVPGHAAQPQVAVDVVGAVHQDLLVKLLCPVVLTQSLIDPGQVIPHCDHDLLVIPAHLQIMS